MEIRNAGQEDIPQLLALLSQVLELHAAIRPDIFMSGTTKYTQTEVAEILRSENKRTYVAVDGDCVLGYAFCEIRQQPFSNTMVPFFSFFIDDLCVDSAARGRQIGRQLFEHAKAEAKKLGCYELTLNVWEGNDAARAFYDKMGMRPKETQLELILG